MTRTQPPSFILATPRHATLRAISVATLLYLGGSSWAQTELLDSVVVSASRAEQQSFDTPAALTAIDRSLIESAGPQVNLSESLNRVPGLTILNRHNYAQDLQLSIRGFGSRAPFGIRGIRLLIDGIPATTPDGQAQGSSVALSSTERIEVLKGPLALLYGNAAGGVIQAWTKDAPAQPEFGLQQHLGSWDTRRTIAQLGGRIGLVGIVADYSTFETDGFRDNSRTQRRQFNSKVSIDLSEQTRLNLILNDFDMPLAQDPMGLTDDELGNPQAAGVDASKNKVRKITSQTQAGASFTHTIDNAQSLTARLYRGERENLQFLANTNWVGLNRDYYGMGLQFNSTTTLGAVPVTWVVGAELDHSSERRQGGASNTLNKTSVTRDEDNIASNKDWFIQGTALLSDSWSATAGVRRSAVELQSKDLYLSDGFDGSGSIRYTATNPLLGVTYHAHDTLNVYANVGRGFETPTLAEVAYIDNGSAVIAEFNKTIKASTSQHAEIGAKWKPTPSTRVDVALYRVNTTNEIVVSRNIGGQTAFKNAPSTRREGIELSTQSMLSDQWRGTVSITTTKAKYTQAFNKVQAGSRLPGVPKHYVFAELAWSAAGFSNVGKKQGLDAGIELINAGTLYANDLNDAKAPSYAVVNLKAAYTWAIGQGLLVAYARIDNAADKNYVGSVIVNQQSRRFYEPAPGRNWTAGIRLNVPF